MSSKTKATPQSLKALATKAMHAIDACRSKLDNTKGGIVWRTNECHAKSVRTDDLDSLKGQVVALIEFFQGGHKLLTELSGMCDANHRLAALPVRLSNVRGFCAELDSIRPTLGATTRGNEVVRGLVDALREQGVDPQGVDHAAANWHPLTNTVKEIISALEGMKTEYSGLDMGLDACRQAEAQIQGADKLMRDAQAELDTLKQTVNLADPHQVGRVSHLMALLAVGPTRRGVLFDGLESAKEALLDAAHGFVQSALIPRCRELEQRALASVEPKLKALYPDADALRNAAYQSAPW